MKKLLLLLTCLLVGLAIMQSGATTPGWSFSSANSAYSTRSSNGWNFTYTAIVSYNSQYVPTLNGKTTQKGTITSPTLKGGISSLSIKYVNTFSDTKAGFDIVISQNGNEVKTLTFTDNSASKNSEKSQEWANLGIQGDFTMKITNNSPSNSTSNKDRTSIIELSWEPNAELGDINVSYSGVDVTENSTVSVPNGTVFNIAADNATSITINGSETPGATATYTATTSETVNVSATDGSNTKGFIFTTDVYEAPAAPTFTIEGEATDNADEYYIGAKLAITATGTIRYTSDGTTTPTAEVGALYNGKIELPLGETTVKAVAYDAGNHCGALTEKTYKVIKYTPEISWSEAEAEANLGKDFTAPTLSVTDGLTVSYVSSKPEVASITADGVVTPLAMGVTTITATTTETDKYTSASASYSLKVVDPNVKEVQDILNLNNFGITGQGYSTYTYESTITGITYGACSQKNNEGMQLNSGPAGSKNAYPGIAVCENPNGLILKSLTIKWAGTISPSKCIYIITNTTEGFTLTKAEDATTNIGFKDVTVSTTDTPSIDVPTSTNETVTYTEPEGAVNSFFGLFTKNAHYIEYVEVNWLMPSTPEVKILSEDNTSITVGVEHADYILHYKKIHNDDWNNHWGDNAAQAPARVAQNTTDEPLADSDSWVSTGANQVTIDKTVADHQNRHYKFTAFHKDDTALANELNHVNFLIDGDGTLTGIEGVEAEAGADAPAEYYDLQGRRVANPVAGLYIRRTGSKVEKVLVK